MKLSLFPFIALELAVDAGQELQAVSERAVYIVFFF